ncbi:DUF7281 domain-containing protein [Halomonas sp. NCCP-2165]|nr:hypothetical protein [Halomonas sp. NCCP-2165]GKW49071.1 hypothetical protein NCCP2165_12860 [Halomonas sp. NCCP-2165]
MPLSANARKLLRDVARGLHRAPRVTKANGKALDEVLELLDEWHIDPGWRRSRAGLSFDRDLLTDIEERLFLSGEPALDIRLGGLTSAEQARHGSVEDKSNREAPRARRVLVSLPAALPRPGIAPEPREVRDLDWRRLDPAAFDVLVQVENLDSFYDLVEPSGPATGARPLVCYRGDSHYGGGFAALADAWAATGKPHGYLGDFDAKGVSLALGSGATHLLLPPLETLAARACAEHQPSRQQEYQPALGDHAARLPAGHPLVPYLRLLLGQQRGLRQQWFESITTLTRVALR